MPPASVTHGGVEPGRIGLCLFIKAACSSRRKDLTLGTQRGPGPGGPSGGARAGGRAARQRGAVGRMGRRGHGFACARLPGARRAPRPGRAAPGGGPGRAGTGAGGRRPAAARPRAPRAAPRARGCAAMPRRRGSRAMLVLVLPGLPGVPSVHANAWLHRARGWRKGRPATLLQMVRPRPQAHLSCQCFEKSSLRRAQFTDRTPAPRLSEPGGARAGNVPLGPAGGGRARCAAAFPGRVCAAGGADPAGASGRRARTGCRKARRCAARHLGGARCGGASRAGAARLQHHWSGGADAGRRMCTCAFDNHFVTCMQCALKSVIHPSPDECVQ